MLRNFIPSVKLLLLAVCIAAWYPPVWIAFKLHKLSARDFMVQLCNRAILYIIGIRLQVSGTPDRVRPMLLVANHTSYLDVPLLGSCLPLCFTPKSEIAAWPVIGSISRLLGCIFIDRRLEKMVEMKQDIRNALAAYRVVCLFPEATTGDGVHLKPFKSGFFSLAEEEIHAQPLTIQPACIIYTHIRGLPITSSQWPSIAWYSDMILAPHAWELLKLGPINAQLHFLPPVIFQDFADRKKLALHCHQLIEDQIQKHIFTG